MQIEWMIMADAAEIVNNKLYMMGGAWDTLVIKRDLPTRHTVSLAVALMVTPEDSPDTRQLSIRINDEADHKLASVNARVDAERISQGGSRSRRVQMAFRLPLRFQQHGRCTVVAAIDGTPAAQTYFQVTKGEESNIQRTPPEELQA